MAREHCVVLGDVVDSQDVEDREALRRSLESAISTINDRHEGSIYAPFDVLKGIDEVGGVLRSVGPVADVNRVFVRNLHPERIRLAAVVGEVDAGDDTTDVSRLTGDAFARADELLADVERDDRTFGLRGNHEAIDGFVADEIDLLDTIRYGWSEGRMAVVSEYERVDTQTEVADRLGISKQAVSKHLNARDVTNVLRIERALDRRLEEYPIC